MYFVYHNDATSLTDTHLYPLRYATLAMDHQNCANISIDVSEGCSKPLPSYLAETCAWQSPTPSFPSCLCKSWRNKSCTLWRKSETNWHVRQSISWLIGEPQWTMAHTCSNTEHKASRKTWRRIDLVRFNTTCWHPRLLIVVQAPPVLLSLSCWFVVLQQDQGIASTPR